MSPQRDSVPVACTLESQELAERIEAMEAELLAFAEETHELPDGIAHRFSESAAIRRALSDLIASERECCPFLHFELVFEPGPGPIWLKVTGPEAARPFIRETFAARA